MRPGAERHGVHGGGTVVDGHEPAARPAPGPGGCMAPRPGGMDTVAGLWFFFAQRTNLMLCCS